MVFNNFFHMINSLTTELYNFLVANAKEGGEERERRQSSNKINVKFSEISNNDKIRHYMSLLHQQKSPTNAISYEWMFLSNIYYSYLKLYF